MMQLHGRVRKNAYHVTAHNIVSFVAFFYRSRFPHGGKTGFLVECLHRDGSPVGPKLLEVETSFQQ
jgi:hypothetical protein